MKNSYLLIFVFLGILHNCYGDECLKPGLYIVEPGRGQCKITEWYPGFEPRSLPEPMLTPDYFVRKMKGYTGKTTKQGIIGPDGFTEEFELSTLNRYESLKKIIKTGDIEKLKQIKHNSPILKRPSDEDFGPLDLAIRYGQPEMLEKLILLGANCNAKDKGGFSPVHTAALLGNVSDLWTLFKYSADANNKIEESPLTSRDTIKRAIVTGLVLTPLHAATTDGDLQKVKALLNNGAKVNVAGKLGWTPLHIAAFKGFNEIYHALLAAGADQTAPDKEGGTPVSYTNDPEAKRKYNLEEYSSEWGRKFFGR